jgi:hypothetical protein
MDAFDDYSREQLVALVLALTEQVRSQAAEIAALKEQLGGGSGSSGAPSRALPDWVKANRPSRPKTERKKRNCAFVRPRGEATSQVEHAPDCCPDCGRTLEGGTLHHTREVIELPDIKVETVEHQFYTRYCGVCRKRVAVACKDALQNQVVGKRRLGVGVMAFIAYLRTMCNMTVEAICQLLDAQFGLELSTGAVIDLLRGVAEVGAPVVETFLNDIRTSPMVHADETSWREDGKGGFVWSFSTPDTRYYVREPSRGSDVVKGVLGEEFNGVLVTDFYSAYSFYPGEHQRCWVHYLRDLHFLKESHPGDQSVQKFVADIRAVFDRAREYDKEDHPQRQRRAQRFVYQEQLSRIAKPFLKQEVPQRVLAERIEKFASELFVFVEYEHTPPDNNPAERAIRPLVTARKVSGGTRSKRGSDTMAVLHSLFATWQLRGQDVLNNFRLLLTGRLDLHGKPAA